HYLKVSGNKVALLSQIEQIIKSDYQPYFQIMQAMEKRIEDEVKKLHWNLRNNPGINSQQSALDLFIKNFSFEFSHYKKDFLFTNLSRTKAIENLLPNLKEDRWFFHFQQNRFFYFLKKLTRLIQSLRQYRYLPLLKTIINYQNEIKASNLFPFESVRNLMVENNIIFNVLLINEPESNQSDIKENLQKICRESGGILLAVKSARTSLEKIKTHKDHFHEIVFNINNKIEEKNIQILAPDYFEKLCYKQTYSADEISSILSNRTRKKVKVDNIMIFKNRISFLLESYEINKKKGYGLIKVQVDVASPHNQTVFHTENTLRATRDQTLVSIQMPFYKSNIFTLTITAYDLMTNHSSEIKHQVQLQETFPITLPQQDLN
ncbi:MAG: hypothetical protein KAT17_02790, partial [Candidatus Aminicenantes bacterium]|nr:hypothetical protein [Candidatus Aminicenantes bacterium]